MDRFISTRSVLAIAATTALSSFAVAGTYDWNNTAAPLGASPPQSGDTWGLGSNWSISGVPQATPPGVNDIANLPAYPAITGVGPQINLSYSIGGIVADNTQADYTLGFGGAGQLSIGSTVLGSASSGIFASGGGTFTIQPSFSTDQNQTWDITSGTTFKFDRQIYGSASVVITGGGFVQGANANSTSRTGTTTVQGGTTIRTGYGSAFGVGNMTVDNGTLELNAGTSVTSWNLQLNNGSTLRGYGSAINAGTYNKSSGLGALPANATVNLESGNASTDVLAIGASSNITGGNASTLVKIGGSGAVVLNAGSGSYQGGWEVTSGQLVLNNSGALGSNAGVYRPITLSGGTLVLGGLNNSYNYNSPVTVASGANTTMQIERTNSNAWAPLTSGSAQDRIVGGLTLNGGTLTARLGSSITSVNTTGGTPYWGAVATFKVNAMTVNAASVLDIEQGSLTNTLATTGIGGSGALEKKGAGRLMIVGSSTYTGDLSVTNGSVLLGTNGATGLGNFSSLNIGSAGLVWSNIAGNNTDTLALPGNLTGDGIFRMGNTNGGLLTVAGQKVISPTGDTAGTAAILDLQTRLTASLSGSDGADLLIDVISGGGVAGTDHDQLAVTGLYSGLNTMDLVVTFDPGLTQADVTGDVLTIVSATGTNFSSLAFNSVVFSSGATADVNYLNGSITLSNIQIPEPASLSVLAMAGMALIRRRR